MRFLFNNFTTLLLTFIFVFIYYLLVDITGYLNKIKSDQRMILDYLFLHIFIFNLLVLDSCET